MKAILEFSLPEEREEFETAMHASDCSLVLWHLTQHLRDKRKHAVLSEDAGKAYDEMWDELWRLREEYGVPED